MKIWQVWDCDYDGDWVVATYATEELARAHAETYGLSRVEEVDVLTALIPEAADPELQQQRAAKRAEESEQAQRRYQDQVERDRREAERIATLTIGEHARPSLCHCRTFSSDSRFISPHGYCRFCGGWEPSVFRAARGESELVSEINKLALHQRQAMWRICGYSGRVRC